MNSISTYAFSSRALGRWCNERLKLTVEPGGGILARFTFEGSTCGNVPLTLVYTARVAPAIDGHRILNLACAPSPGDDGHERMCSYIVGAEGILDTLQTECPLLGQPLADALMWRPPTSPAGCVCAAPARNHKWLAVLQTLHFALVGSTATPPSYHEN